MMYLALLIFLIVFCQIVELALDYAPENDTRPNHLLHRFLRKMNGWIFRNQAKG